MGELNDFDFRVIAADWTLTFAASEMQLKLSPSFHLLAPVDQQ